MADFDPKDLGKYGLTTPAAVIKQLEERERSGEFVGLIRARGAAPETTTEKTLRMEERNLLTVAEGRGTQTLLADAMKGGAIELFSAYEKKKAST